MPPRLFKILFGVRWFRGRVIAAMVLILIALWPLAATRRATTGNAAVSQRDARRDATLPTFDGVARDCDVLVVGGTPSGVAAALAASRRGAKTILIEERAHLGGDIVYAMLNMFDVPARPGEASPVHGIFAEFFDQLGLAFDIERVRHLFEDATRIEPNLQVFARTRITRLLKTGDRITGATLQSTLSPASPTQSTLDATITARVVIDATDDARIAARGGAGYYIGRENANPDKRMQSAGLLFSVSGVDWNRVRLYARSKNLIEAARRRHRKYAIDVAPIETKFKVQSPKSKIQSRGAKRGTRGTAKTSSEKIWLRLGGAHGNYAWERGDIVKRYKPQGRDLLFLSINFGRQSDNTVVLNTLNIVGVNGLSEVSKARARAQAVRELPRFINYLRRAMPGFERARLARVAPELYIRETRHIHGFYALKVEDVRAQRRFPDRIAMASYPLDLHPYHKGDTNPFGPQRFYYTLPLRCLIPRRVDGVFVASRSLSATYSAAGSARVIPVTMAAGEAAGAAAWLCAQKNISPHEMIEHFYPRWAALVQHSLRDWGADVGDKLRR